MGVTNTAASGAVMGWPVSPSMGLGYYTIQVSYFSDNATPPNTGSGINSFPVAEVITQKLPNVQQSVSATLPFAANVYTAGTWGTPAVNPNLLPSSFVIKLWESEPTNHAHVYSINMTLVSASAGAYSGALPVDKAPNTGGTQPSPIAGMFAGQYWANEILTFSEKFVLPTVTDGNAASTTVTGDVWLHLISPFRSANLTPVIYKPNSWYSVNGTATDNYGHPIAGLSLFFIQPPSPAQLHGIATNALYENQSLITNSEGELEPAPNSGYVLIIPSDAPNGNYYFTFQ